MQMLVCWLLVWLIDRRLLLGFSGDSSMNEASSRARHHQLTLSYCSHSRTAWSSWVSPVAHWSFSILSSPNSSRTLLTAAALFIRGTPEASVPVTWPWGNAIGPSSRCLPEATENTAPSLWRPRLAAGRTDPLRQGKCIHFLLRFNKYEYII